MSCIQQSDQQSFTRQSTSDDTIPNGTFYQAVPDTSLNGVQTGSLYISLYDSHGNPEVEKFCGLSNSTFMVVEYESDKPMLLFFNDTYFGGGGGICSGGGAGGTPFGKDWGGIGGPTTYPLSADPPTNQIVLLDSDKVYTFTQFNTLAAANAYIASTKKKKKTATTPVSAVTIVVIIAFLVGLLLIVAVAGGIYYFVTTRKPSQDITDSEDANRNSNSPILVLPFSSQAQQPLYTALPSSSNPSNIENKFNSAPRKHVVQSAK